jgi:hypothetical protein
MFSGGDFINTGLQAGVNGRRARAVACAACSRFIKVLSAFGFRPIAKSAGTADTTAA